MLQSDILCLQETYMKMCMENEQFQNFTYMSNCIGHGVMILVKKHIPILEHMHFKGTKF
jgi:exonuclease III